MPAIKPHSTATTDAAWSASTHETRLQSPLTATDAQGFYGWHEEDGNDPNEDGMPDYKNAYKFGHHMVSDTGACGAANLTACSHVVAVLNGARGGTDIPTPDRQGVYDHVAKHLRAAGKEPPALGATAEESERFCEDVKAAERYTLEEARSRVAQEQHGPALPPVLPVGRKAWALQDGALHGVLERAKHATMHLDNTRALASAIPQAATRTLGSATQRAAGAVAVIPLCGIITPRGSLLSMLFGGGRGGLTQFREDFTDAVTSPEIGAIVLDIDSPGGLTDLVPETAAMIRAAKGNGKPIIAVANTLAASAAYWLASQADELVVTPSGEVGSVGVYMLHEDYSGWNERLGVNPTYVKTPRFKAEGNPDEPLGDETLAAWQSEVDDIYAMFVADIAEGRGVSEQTVRAQYGEGRCLLASRALEAGMCDRLGTLESVVGELLGAPAGAEDPDTVPAGAFKVELPGGVAISIPDGLKLADVVAAATKQDATPAEIAAALVNAAAGEPDDEDDEDEDEPAEPTESPDDTEDEDDEDEEDEDEEDEPTGEPIADDEQDSATAEAVRRASLLFD